MRVIIATRIFSPEPAAASFRLAALANALARGGDDVVVLTGRLRDATTTDVDETVRVSRWPVLRDASGTVRGYLQYLSFDIPLLLRLLLARKPDVVVAEPPPTTGAVVRLACGIRRIPYVYYASDVWADALKQTTVPRSIAKVVSAVERSVLGKAARVIAVSDAVAKTVSRISPRSTVRAVTNGVDTTIFSPAGKAHSELPTLVYAGTTSEWQGADIFVRAMPAVARAVPTAQLVFLGQGSAWTALRSLAIDLGVDDRVDFVGVVSPRVAATYLRGGRASLVSLRPGQGYDFAVPTKIFASAAVGTPVLFAGPDGGAADVVRGGALGTAVAFDLAAVETGMVVALAAAPAQATRAALRDWALVNASAETTGDRAARAVRETEKR